jgi:DNA-binding transcriptional LysR family regulator
MLNVARLRVLREVAARGSFSEAADALSYTQSAVSQAVATLEAEVGVRLIERDRGAIRPTAAGAVLVERTGPILVQLEAAEDEVAAIAGARGGRLRMASFPTGGATLMPVAIANFRASHPDVEVMLSEAEPEDLVPRLRGGELDPALLFEFQGNGTKLVAGMRRFDLLSDPMRLAVPAGHQLGRRERIDLSDLRGEPWVQTSAASACARHVVRLCHAAGFEPHVSFESDDYQTVQGLVAAGVGIALIPQLALSNVRDDIVIRGLGPDEPVRRVLLATPRGASMMPAVASMIDILRGAARRYG